MSFNDPSISEPKPLRVPGDRVVFAGGITGEVHEVHHVYRGGSLIGIYYSVLVKRPKARYPVQVIINKEDLEQWSHAAHDTPKPTRS